ncbi:hypothetical protein HNQ77_001595 [Silvibacterium bohemicum]|uniref:Uncharacterized protein n=1 Tax=Silvibacterium bohemicum TaxID=1577686 RepID=A0A841JQN8_9BACT|nr:hypothetical protein [Silvibacterium bohemicum]
MKMLIAAIDEEISRLMKARALLAGSNGSSGMPGRKPVTLTATRVKRNLSPDARKRIADAQRRRWAAVKKDSR